MQAEISLPGPLGRILSEVELVSPSTKYKDSYLEAVKEMRADGRVIIFDFDLAEEDFAAYVRQLNDWSLGLSQPEGFVPETVYWLVEGDYYIGRASVRHYLNQHLLEIGGHIAYDVRPSERNKGYGKRVLGLVLPKAKKMGLDRVLVTCDVTNIPSRKVIEANGGILENEVGAGEGLPNKLRFWIQF